MLKQRQLLAYDWSNTTMQTPTLVIESQSFPNVDPTKCASWECLRVDGLLELMVYSSTGMNVPELMVYWNECHRVNGLLDECSRVNGLLE